MNTIRLFSFFFALVLLGLTSCKKDDDSNVKINIEEEFDVQLFEELLPGQNNLRVHVATKENLACSNVILGHSINSIGGNITVSIDSLELNGACDNIEAIAQTIAELGEIEEGTYDLEINLALNSITNQGEMIVSEEGYRVEMNTTHGLTMLENNLYGIPDDYFWGYIELLDNSASNLPAQFLGTLETYTKDSELREGYYGHFDIKENRVTLNGAATNIDIPGGAIPFLYRLNVDKTELKSFILNFQTDQENIAKVVMYMGDGEVL